MKIYGLMNTLNDERMSRTKGSGWGAGTLLYQLHRGCGKKKAIYDPIPDTGINPFKCLYCRRRFWDSSLLRYKYANQIIKQLQNDKTGM